jgi:hypothetical protein
LENYTKKKEIKMAYKMSTMGPGDIAALPPTIGATSRVPTIGAEDVGIPIKKRFSMGNTAEPCSMTSPKALIGSAFVLALGIIIGKSWSELA